MAQQNQDWGSRGGASMVLEAKSQCILWRTPSVSRPSHRREEQDVTRVVLGTWLRDGTSWPSSSAWRGLGDSILCTAVCTQGPQALLCSHRRGSRGQAVFQGPGEKENKSLLGPQGWLTLNSCFSPSIYQCIRNTMRPDKF